MKKLLLSLVIAGGMFTVAQAQADATAKPQMTKAEKDAAKLKKETDLKEAFLKAGATAEQEAKTREILDKAYAEAKEIRKDTTLSEEDKKKKLDAVYDSRNEAMKEVLGNDIYKAFKAAQKAQKEAASN